MIRRAPVQPEPAPGWLVVTAVVVSMVVMLLLCYLCGGVIFSWR